MRSRKPVEVNDYESPIQRQTIVRQLQGGTSGRPHLRHLLQSASQATSGMS